MQAIYQSRSLNVKLAQRRLTAWRFGPTLRENRHRHAPVTMPNGLGRIEYEQDLSAPERPCRRGATGLGPATQPTSTGNFTPISQPTISRPRCTALSPRMSRRRPRAAEDHRLLLGRASLQAADVLRIVGTKQVEMGDVAFGFVAGDVPELNACRCRSPARRWTSSMRRWPRRSRSRSTRCWRASFRSTSIMQWVMPPQQLWLTKPVHRHRELEEPQGTLLNREQAELMRLVGGSVVTITPAEVIPALQRGVVDGAFTAAVPALDWKFNEVTKYAYMMNLTLAHQAVVVNQAALQGATRGSAQDPARQDAGMGAEIPHRVDRGRQGRAQDAGRTRRDPARCDA